MNNSNSPAFPVHPETTPNFEEHEYGGLTKREYFAAMAMQGFCANPGAYSDWGTLQIIEQAVKHADALLLYLQKQSTQ